MVSKKMVRNKQNTPGIIKYPFWKLTKQNTRARYICVNDQEAYAPGRSAHRQFVLSGISVRFCVQWSEIETGCLSAVF